MKHFSSHCGSLSEPAIRNGEQSEIGCPQSQTKYGYERRLLTACREFQFRTDRLTRLVPTPVRFVLWNDSKKKQIKSPEFEGIKLS